MKNGYVFVLVFVVLIGVMIYPAEAFVVDNKPYTNVIDGVTNIVIHDWAWACNEVHEYMGGSITFDVDESPLYVGGGYFSVEVDINGLNKSKKVIFNGTLTLDYDYCDISNCDLRQGVVVNNRVACNFANNIITSVSGCSNFCSFYNNQIDTITLADHSIISENTIYESVAAGSECEFRKNILSSCIIYADSKCTFSENVAVVTSGLSRVYMYKQNLFEKNRDISLEIRGASNVVKESSIRNGIICKDNNNEFRDNDFTEGSLSVYGDFTEVTHCNMSNSTYGLIIHGTNTDVSYCNIHHNSRAGIDIQGEQTTVTRSDIHANKKGIEITGSDIMIGGEQSFLRNYIHKNAGVGIDIVDAENIRIEANYIGALSKYGFNTNGNLGHGIAVTGGEDIRIGQSIAGSQNLIRGNVGHGISYTDEPGIDHQFRVLGNVINGNALAGVYINGGFNVRIEGNYLGTDESDQIDTGNLNGVLAENSPNLLIGGGIPAARNIISGNNLNGVQIKGNRNNPDAMAGARIMGNYIGTTRNGDAPLPNPSGVRLTSCNQVSVGGAEAGQGNLISGNADAGIRFDDGPTYDNPFNNRVIGNRIGTDVSGTTSISNKVGIRLCGLDNIIGGSQVGEGNLISGNAVDGIQLNIPYPEATIASSNNTIQGNFIGTDASGSNALPNIRYGISVLANTYSITRDNCIGGTNASNHHEGNLISGNGSNGIHFTSRANLNHIDGNIIGLNADASAALGNGACGICIQTTGDYSYAYANGIGEREGNIIAGNQRDGIHLDGGVDNTIILNNRIGLNDDNTIFPNQGHGILLTARIQSSIIGRSRTNGYNIICGNTGCGIYMDHEYIDAGSVVCGNYIGAIPGLFDNTYLNQGPAAIYANGGDPEIGNRNGGGNVLNAPVGIHLQNTRSSETMGNYIGFDPAHSMVSTCMQYGILMEHAQSDDIGDDLQDGPMPGNFIGATMQAGIKIVASDYIQLRDNRIGCAQNNAGYVTNYGPGIVVSTNCNDVRVGQSSMTVSSEYFGPNYIAGNTHGVLIEDATNLHIQLNYIGLTPVGTVLGNRGDGIQMVNGYYNRIGDYFDEDEPKSTIIASAGAGIRLINTSGAVVFGTRIGLLPTSSTAAPNMAGGLIVNNCEDCILGHEGYPNIIAGNQQDGILLAGLNCSNNRVSGNYIGLDKDNLMLTGNAGNGISIVDAHDNECEQNTIAGNSANGIQISGDTAVHNTLSMNAMYDNGLRGICLGTCGLANDPQDTDSGPNNYQNHPIITNAWRGTTHVFGYLESQPNNQYILEFFASESLNSSGQAEGRVFLGADWVDTDANGYAPFAFVGYMETAPVGWIITATAITDDGDTSEFSPYSSSCVVKQAPADYDPGGRDPANWGGPNTDYDGDGKSDINVYYPKQGEWYLQCSSNQQLISSQLGWSETIPVPADYDGDNRMDMAVFWPEQGRWYIIDSATDSLREIQWGWADCVPVPGDYDGDGLTDIAVYGISDGNWYIQYSNGGMLTMQWGGAEYMPVPGDYDGDDVSDFAVYEIASGDWSILESFIGTRREINWGWAGAQPVPGDYDGDSKADIAVFDRDTGNWYIRLSTTQQLELVTWGLPGTVPVVGDYDGDKLSDYTVYDPTDGRWFILYSSGQGRTQTWGWENAIPTSLQFMINRLYQ